MSEALSRDGLYVPGDPHITRFNSGHYVQAITINSNFIMVEDPGVGDFIIDNTISYKLHTSANAMRSMAVSQLCTSMESATTPNTSNLSRLECSIAQHPMVERWGRQQRLSREHIDAIHIAVEPSDYAHPAYSHLVEQAIQKWGGHENWHQKEWPKIAELGGAAEALREGESGVMLDEFMRVPGYDIPEWAERSDKRDLDVDNLQYIIAEGLRTFDHDDADPSVREKVRKAVNLDNYTITENGVLAVKDPETALVMAKLIMLFSAGHWNDPLNRAHMHLRIHAIQRSITQRRLSWMDEIDRGETRDPIGYYMGIDDDYTRALQTGPGKSDDFIYIVGNTLHASGMEERKRFTDYKLGELERFMTDDQASSFPSQYLTPKRVDFGPKPSTVDIEPVKLTAKQKRQLAQRKIPQLDDNSETLSYLVGPLKNRYIDPLVVAGNGDEVRLSEHSSIYGRAFAKLFKEHQILQELGVRVRFAFNPEYADEFRQGMRANDDEFEAKALNREPMTDDQKRRVIEMGANRAVQMGQASGRLILKRELSF